MSIYWKTIKHKILIFDKLFDLMIASKNSAKKCNKKIRLISLTAILLFTIIIFCNSIDSEILYGWDDGEYTTNEDIQNIDVKKFSKRIELQPEYANAIYNRGTMPDTTSTRLKRHARTGRRQLNLDQKKLR